MTLPPGFTEGEVLEALEKAVRILAPSFVFGCYDLEDIKQQARLFGLQGLSKYDPSRPLGGFLYSHIRNRLINFRRDKLRRNDPPCAACHASGGCADGTPCGRYAAWLGRQNAKAGVMCPLDISRVPEDRFQRECSPDQTMEATELADRIDAELPVALRADYLRMRDGVPVPHSRRQAVMEAIRGIIG